MGTRFKNSPQNSRPCGFQVLGPTWMANLGALWPCWTLILWGHPATPNAKACREQLEPRTSIGSELPRNLKSTVKGFCPLSKYSQPNSLWDHACLIIIIFRIPLLNQPLFKQSMNQSRANPQSNARSDSSSFLFVSVRSSCGAQLVPTAFCFLQMSQRMGR